MSILRTYERNTGLALVARMQNRLLPFALLISLVACGKVIESTYHPYENVNVLIKIKGLKAQPKHKASFLYFDLQISNKSDTKYSINVGDIKAKLGNVSSRETHYDSLASVMPERKELKRGTSIDHLYFVFPEGVSKDEISGLEITDFGITVATKQSKKGSD